MAARAKQAPPSQTTRRHIAQTMHRVLAVALFPLRLITANPLPEGFLPKLDKSRTRGFLFPDEEARLLAGRDADGKVVVALDRRVMFGFLAREGMRKEEAAQLEWTDVDEVRGWVRLDKHKSVAKTGARDWPLDPGVAAALTAWKAMAPKGARYVFGGSEPVNVDTWRRTCAPTLWRSECTAPSCSSRPRPGAASWPTTCGACSSRRPWRRDGPRDGSRAAPGTPTAR